MSLLSTSTTKDPATAETAVRLFGAFQTLVDNLENGYRYRWKAPLSKTSPALTSIDSSVYIHSIGISASSVSLPFDVWCSFAGGRVLLPSGEIRREPSQVLWLVPPPTAPTPSSWSRVTENIPRTRDPTTLNRYLHTDALSQKHVCGFEKMLLTAFVQTVSDTLSIVQTSAPYISSVYAAAAQAAGGPAELEAACCHRTASTWYVPTPTLTAAVDIVSAAAGRCGLYETAALEMVFERADGRDMISDVPETTYTTPFRLELYLKIEYTAAS